MSGEEESAEQAATARRERLKALRAAHQLLSNPDGSEDKQSKTTEDDEEQTNQEENNVSMKFRNYLPHDKQLQEGKLEAPVLPKFEDPIASAPLQSEKIEDPFVHIAPKKPNWDLRRDVQKKLDKLERRTQKAIFQLMGKLFILPVYILYYVFKFDISDSYKSLKELKEFDKLRFISSALIHTVLCKFQNLSLVGK